MTIETQSSQILSYLKTGHSLTPLDALGLFGCFRLGARIYDLRQAGHNIDSQRVETHSGARVSEYWMARE